MADDHIEALAYAVRGRVILKYTGQLGLMLAVLTVVPCGVALVLGDFALAARYAVVVGVLLVAGGLLVRLPAPERVQPNEALAITALAFVIVPLLMSFPMMGAGLTFLDALFEAVSGVTTTGLTTLASVEDKPAAFLFGRAWMQWYGGLGIVVLSVALLMGHTMAARRLAEPAYGGEDVVATTRTLARRVLYVYLVLTGLGFAALWAVLGDGFTALVHALAAVSTGGFSSRDASLAGLAPSGAAPVAMAIAFLGAVSLPLYYRAFHEGWRVALTDPELRALLGAAALIAAALVALLLAAGGSWGEALWHGALVGVSAQTGTGYTTVEPATLGPAARVALLASMVVGGCVGSTTGGVKLLRLLMVLRMVQWTVQRSATPLHAVVQPRLGGRVLEPDDVIRALLLIVLFLLVIGASWLAFVVAGYDALNALFEVVSATATVGLSTGITRSELEPVLKGILCFDMLAGRVEVVALLVLLYPRTWVGKRGETS